MVLTTALAYAWSGLRARLCVRLGALCALLALALLTAVRCPHCADACAALAAVEEGDGDYDDDDEEEGDGSHRVRLALDRGKLGLVLAEDGVVLAVKGAALARAASPSPPPPPPPPAIAPPPVSWGLNQVPVRIHSVPGSSALQRAHARAQRTRQRCFHAALRPQRCCRRPRA